MAVALDAVVIDRRDAETLAAESSDVFFRLQQLTARLSRRHDEDSRRLLADVRAILPSARWIDGALKEALA